MVLTPSESERLERVRAFIAPKRTGLIAMFRDATVTDGSTIGAWRTISFLLDLIDVHQPRVLDTSPLPKESDDDDEEEDDDQA